MGAAHLSRQLVRLSESTAIEALHASVGPAANAPLSSSSTRSSFRTFASSSSAPTSGASEQNSGSASSDSQSSHTEGSNRNLPPYDVWKDGPGRRLFEKPVGTGPHWIGNTPFPLNPTFCPAPPVSQKVRDELWKLHRSNHRKNTIRVLSTSFGLTLQRTQAILRLKALEIEMKAQSKPLQSEFQREMECLLGSSQEVPTGRSFRLLDPTPTPEMEESFASARTRGRLVDLEETNQEADDANDGNSGSAATLIKALAAERGANKARNSAILTGGPDANAIKVAEIFRRGSQRLRPSAVPNRAKWKALDLSPNPEIATRSGRRSWESYAGAGTLMQNQKRAARRNRSKARRRSAHAEGESAAAAATAAKL